MTVISRPAVRRLMLSVRGLLISPRWLPRLVLGYMLAVFAVTGFHAERLGDRYQVALPLLGLSCAAATGSAPEYVLRYMVAWSGMRLAKNTLGDRPYALRPGGGQAGMPSGHTTSAVVGASALVTSCLASSPPGQAVAILAAGFTGASRVSAGAHTIWQVFAAVIWAIVCERAFRREGPARRAILGAIDAVRAAIAGSGGRTRQVRDGLRTARLKARQTLRG